jgi:hypothetical protein
MKKDIKIFTPRSISNQNKKDNVNNVFSMTSLLTPNKITQSIDMKTFNDDIRSSIEAPTIHHGIEDSHTIKKKA